MSDITHSVIGDIRFAARQLRRNLPLTIAALLCFALGVGANTSIFPSSTRCSSGRCPSRMPTSS
jgi:hypothetical protein